MSHKNQIEIYQFNSRAKYWLVRAEGGKYYDDFKYNHFISIHHNQVTLADLQTTDLLLTTEKNYRALQATNSKSVSRQKSIKTPNYIYC